MMQSTKLSPVDDYRSFYQGLQHTGIDYYFKKDPQGLQSDRPVVCAACLVVLEQNPKHLTASQRTILDGMLKVLDLSKDDYCVAWIPPSPPLGESRYPQQGERDLIQQAILKYGPYSVLFLGSAFETSAFETIEIADTPIAYTYSPAELETDPKLKRSAFDTLLGLKKQLKNDVQ